VLIFKLNQIWCKVEGIENRGEFLAGVGELMEKLLPIGD
jgi:hypothetical protein